MDPEGRQLNTTIHLSTPINQALPDRRPGPRVHNLNTGKDYGFIKEAIDDPNTTTGHTIVADSGTYYERILINKSLRIVGLDTGRGVPVINGEGRGDVVTLSADTITLEGFNITNAGITEIATTTGPAGIRVTSQSNTIKRNEVSGNEVGICAKSSSHNTITDNYIHGNKALGIYLCQGSRNNTITDNLATDNSEAVYLLQSYCNIIAGNDFADNTESIHLKYSQNNTITRNNATDRRPIYLEYSSKNIIAGNRCMDSIYDGIYLESSSGVTLVGNVVGNSTGTGISLHMSGGCTLKNNTMFGNTYNLEISGISPPRRSFRWEPLLLLSPHVTTTFHVAYSCYLLCLPTTKMLHIPCIIEQSANLGI